MLVMVSSGTKFFLWYYSDGGALSTPHHSIQVFASHVCLPEDCYSPPPRFFNCQEAGQEEWDVGAEVARGRAAREEYEALEAQVRALCGS